MLALHVGGGRDIAKENQHSSRSDGGRMHDAGVGDLLWGLSVSAAVLLLFHDNYMYCRRAVVKNVATRELFT